jgi:hypothetical protein
VFGVKKQIGPVLADARETLATARQQLAVIVMFSAAALVVSLLTLLTVRGLARG